MQSNASKKKWNFDSSTFQLFSTLRQKSVGHSQPSQLGDYCEPHGRSKNMRSKSCKDQTKGSNTQNQGTSHFRTVPQTITRGPQVTIWIHLVHSGSKGSHSGTGPLRRWYSLSWAVRISPSLPRPIAGSLGGMYSVLHLFIESHEEASEGRPAASSKCPLPARRQRLPPKWNPSPGAGLVENLWKNIKNWQNSKTNRTSGTNCLIDWVKNRGTELKDYILDYFPLRWGSVGFKEMLQVVQRFNPRSCVNFGEFTPLKRSADHTGSKPYRLEA